jgi:hypothetical protein
MSDTEDDLSPLGTLVDEFLEQWRRGERPAVEDYAQRHPPLASRLREALTALVLLEDLARSEEAAPSGDRPPAGPPAEG